MKVHELIKQLESLPKDKEIMCQLSNNGAAVNFGFEFNDVKTSSFVQLRVFHPLMKTAMRHLNKHYGRCDK